MNEVPLPSSSSSFLFLISLKKEQVFKPSKPHPMLFEWVKFYPKRVIQIGGVELRKLNTFWPYKEVTPSTKIK